MRATTPDMPRATPIRQDQGRPHVRPAQNGRTLPMMSQPLASITFSDAQRAEVGSILANVYQEVLLQLQGADRLRKAAGVDLPAEAASLYAYLLPRQAVQR